MSSESSPIREVNHVWSKYRPVDNGGVVLDSGVPERLTDEPSIENTQAFFGAMSFDRSSGNVPSPFVFQAREYQSYGQWERKWRIAGKRLGLGQTLAKCAEEEGITPEATRVIVEKLITKSYETAPVRLRDVFSRDVLSGADPEYRGGKRISPKKSEVLKQLTEALEQGKGAAEIIEETGLKNMDLTRFRQEGINVPYFNDATSPEYRQRISMLGEGLLDDAQVLDLFKDIEDNNRFRICLNLQRDGAIMPISSYARSRGIIIGIKEYEEVYDCLKAIKLPVIRVKRIASTPKGDKQQNYYYVLNNHSRTEEIFSEPQPITSKSA